MPLTDTMLRNLKSDGTPAKLADSEGLYLYLSASDGKLWRMDYRHAIALRLLSARLDRCSLYCNNMVSL